MEPITFVMLRATTKQTVVEYQGQTARNDSFYEDSSTSSDFYTVFCDELLRYFVRVEIWYQEDRHHPKCSVFEHRSGLVERYWPKGYEGLTEGDEPEILFVRGDKRDYYPVLNRFRKAFKVYYSAGHYYLPPTQGTWNLVFVDDPRHIKEVEESAYCPVELFKKSCVDKYFPGKKGQGAVDIYFTCNAPQANIKGFRFFLRLMRDLRNKSALCVGLRNEGMEKEFKGLPVYFTGFVPRVHVGQLMARCRMGLVLSGKEDGSPRVIQEYICSDFPVVVREQTTHSPFYINSMTGISASDEKMRYAIIYTLNNRELFAPRKYFMESLTVEQSAKYFVDKIMGENAV